MVELETGRIRKVSWRRALVVSGVRAHLAARLALSQPKEQSVRPGGTVTPLGALRGLPGEPCVWGGLLSHSLCRPRHPIAQSGSGLGAGVSTPGALPPPGLREESPRYRL
eukprot:3676746-Prymnesium_polylepis.1